MFKSKYTGEALEAALDSISSKANKSTTLGGYGITDAYTKAEIDAMFATIIAVRSGSATPQSSLGDNGDIYLQI